MQYKIAQEMIQEVVDGSDADVVVKTFVEGEKKDEEDVKEEPETPAERARRFLEKKGIDR